MSFARSLLLLLTLAAAVLLPIFVGHGLASHHSSWVLVGLASGVVAGILMFVVASGRWTSAEDRGPHRSGPPRH